MAVLASLAAPHLSALGLSTSSLTSFAQNLNAHDILSLSLRFALMGVAAAWIRVLFAKTRIYFTGLLFPTAYIPVSDPAFNWVMTYLAQDTSAQAQIRSFRVLTADARELKRDEYQNAKNSQNKKRRGWPFNDTVTLEGKGEASFVMGNVVGQISPINERPVRISHNGEWLWVNRSDAHFAMTNTPREDHITVTGLMFQPGSIKNFLVSAHDLFFKKSDSEILIFHPSPQIGNWYDPISRPSRTWRSVILPSTVKDDLLKDVKDFFSDEEQAWYAERGIPHRRGYLLHGRPGAGKTTLATAVASALKLDIYVVNPSARGMDDGKLNKAFRSCPPGNMILIEDIDCVMPKRGQARKDHKEAEADNDGEDGDDDNAGSPDPGQYGFAKSTVTLSGLLNAIDGVSSQEDCVLFASTNNPELLDSALSRPGRFDVHIPFYDATPAQALALYKHFYPPSDLKTQDSEKEMTEAERDEQIQALAQEFAASIFPTNPLTDGVTVPVSMAALQGYLLKHKKNPEAAARGAAAFADETRGAEQDKLDKKLERSKAKALKEAEAIGPPTPVSLASPAPAAAVAA